MILSCIARTEQKYPEEIISALMKGREVPISPEELDPAKLTTFGLMREKEEEEILEIIDALSIGMDLRRVPPASFASIADCFMWARILL